MKATQLREMTENELNQKMADTRKELFNLRFQIAAGQLENTHKLNSLRKDIARILTIKEQKKLSPQEQELIQAQKPKKAKAESKKEAKVKEVKVAENKAVKADTSAKANASAQTGQAKKAEEKPKKSTTVNKEKENNPEVK